MSLSRQSLSDTVSDYTSEAFYRATGSGIGTTEGEAWSPRIRGVGFDRIEVTPHLAALGGVTTIRLRLQVATVLDPGPGDWSDLGDAQSIAVTGTGDAAVLTFAHTGQPWLRLSTWVDGDPGGASLILRRRRLAPVAGVTVITVGGSGGGGDPDPDPDPDPPAPGGAAGSWVEITGDQSARLAQPQAGSWTLSGTGTAASPYTWALAIVLVQAQDGVNDSSHFAYTLAEILTLLGEDPATFDFQNTALLLRIDQISNDRQTQGSPFLGPSVSVGHGVAGDPATGAAGPVGTGAGQYISNSGTTVDTSGNKVENSSAPRQALSIGGNSDPVRLIATFGWGPGPDRRLYTAPIIGNGANGIPLVFSPLAYGPAGSLHSDDPADWQVRFGVHGAGGGTVIGTAFQARYFVGLERRPAYP